MHTVGTVDGKRGVITEESSASSRGQPGIVLDGMPYRAGDLLNAEIRLIWDNASGQRLLARWKPVCHEIGDGRKHLDSIRLWTLWSDSEKPVHA